jgi:hypothetical protein
VFDVGSLQAVVPHLLLGMGGQVVITLDDLLAECLIDGIAQLPCPDSRR